jgi:MFS family permease
LWLAGGAVVCRPGRALALISRMGARRSLGRQFGWLWAAYAVSAYGSGFGLGAFPLIAVRVLHAGPAEVAAVTAAGLAVAAVVAVPLGPWMEFRRKRPVMVAMDLTRFAALLSIPAAYALGWLTFAQLVVVAVIVGAAKIAFQAASGAFMKTLVPPEDLLVANGRFESTTWTSIVLGPPLGGAAIGLFGPVTTVLADAVSYLFSAAGIGAIGGCEPRPACAAAPRSPGSLSPASRPRPTSRGLRAGDLLDGWRYILTHPALRPLFLNTIAVSGLIMATEPLLSVLMLGPLGFAPWQYGLAFAVPCTGGLIGSRLARRLVARYGRRTVMLTAGTLRACWLFWLAFIRPGAAGLVLVIVVEFGLIICIGVFNPVYATYRLEQTATERTARTLSAWSISSNATIAAMTALWGLLASLTSPRAAIALAGLLILATPLLLPRHDRAAQPASPLPAPPASCIQHRHAPQPASRTSATSRTSISFTQLRQLTHFGKPHAPRPASRTSASLARADGSGPDAHRRPLGNDIDGPSMSL